MTGQFQTGLAPVWSLYRRQGLQMGRISPQYLFPRSGRDSPEKEKQCAAQ